MKIPDEIFSAIEQVLSTDADYPLDGTLLYAEVGDRYVRASIFKRSGDKVVYRWPMDALTLPLLRLWEVEASGKRWEEVEYLLRGGRFEVKYTYPDEIDAEEDPLDRRDRVVRRYFGDIPIVYPGLPTDDDLQQFKL